MDEGNLGKNWEKHHVSDGECEEIFFHEPLTVRSDVAHSGREVRYYALGKSGRGRLLFVAFTIRNRQIRVISASDVSAKERKVYERTEEDTGIQN